MTLQDYELVAAQHSYYSAKVRACLQYKRLPYQEIGTNIETILNRVITATGNQQFPVVFCPDGTVLKDGCDIVEALEARHPERPIMPENSQLKCVAKLIETLADEFFVIPMIYYRWVPEETKQWGVGMFQMLLGKGIENPDMAALAEQMGETISSEIRSRLPKVGLDRKHIQDKAQEITKEVCSLLDKHFAKTPYMLGDHPTLADLGIMNTMWGHLYLDPCKASMFIRKDYLHLNNWITNMHSGAGISDQGELYIADTLVPLLRYLSDTLANMMTDTLAAADKTLPAAEAGTEAPAGLGRIETTLLDAELSRPATSYTAWRLQKVIEQYQAIPATQKPAMDDLLSDIGFLSVCQHQPKWRLQKDNFKLFVAS
ncbi:glutathione S-transferase family protein [uncultured Pseudoteredinibacter sp.]|uniref:glutathione S-transferase family protein n=1 Tax=uncultured Pseudoteredinibacter sp. TaxID=1641701 RepID=UPI002618C1A8|nr:glutathione S-transferase family protein [uncultured Pseudoteredinibacter sp.]